MITITNEDCIGLLKRSKDKEYDLAIVDVPYGIGEDGSNNHSRGKLAKPKDYKPFAGNDKEAPSVEYWAELFRVSKNQIVWGANHFISRLPIDSPCWIVWDKNNSGDFADCELAWTSFKTAVRKYKYTWNGMLQEDMKNKEIRIHPTQKPVKLYEWLLMNYAKEGDKILDTHGGSMSIALAIHNMNSKNNMNLSLTLCELDKEYYEAGLKRYNNHIMQKTIFDM